jgi:superfamily II DNA or RNA helicase
MAPEIVAQAYREHAEDRPGILFWPSVETAYLGAESMIAQGFTCEVIEGSMSREDRRLALKKAESGEVQTLSSCMVLTEGFDNPRMSCAVIARPTDSAPLYQQMVGRVLRPHPESGKTDALVLDVVGAGKQHTLEALIDLEDKTKKAKRDEDELDEDDLPRGGGMGLEEVIPYSGETVALEFDPLAKSSKRVWLTTSGTDTRFLAAGVEFYLFLAPGVVEGNWTVAWCRKVPRTGYGARAEDNYGFTEHAELPLDMAMRWAEQIVTENYGDEAAHKRAGWRDDFASVSLLTRARRMKIKKNFRLGSSKAGEVEDLIEQHQASPRIDPLIKQLKGNT